MAALNRPNGIDKSMSIMNPIPENCNVGKWNVGQKEVIVFKEGNVLRYSVLVGGNQQKRGSISADTINLYGVRWAMRIIQIFERVVQANLESWIDSQDGIGSQTFLPILYMEGYVQNERSIDNTNVKVALFGRPKPEGMGLRAIGARWGVFDPSEAESVSFCEVDELSGEALSFIKKFRDYRPVLINQEHTEDCKHPIEDIGVGKRCIRSYEKEVGRLRAIMSTNSESRISSIDLKYVSNFNPNVILSENSWAITVVSGRNLTCGGRVNIGHAMIACEGLENGKFFLKYVHISPMQVPEGEEKHSNRAWIDIIQPQSSHKITITSQGPTWTRPRNLVERMIKPLEEAQHSVKFSDKKDAKDSTFRGVAAIVGGIVMVAGGALAIGGGVAGAAIGYSIIQADIAAGTYVSAIAFKTFCAATALGATPGLAIGAPAAMIVDASASGELEANREEHNCSSWVREILKTAGIKILQPMISFTPCDMIKHLNSSEKNFVLD